MLHAGHLQAQQQQYIEQQQLLLAPKQQAQPPGMMQAQAAQLQLQPLLDSLADEEDYVIVDPAPCSQASSQASRSRCSLL